MVKRKLDPAELWAVQVFRAEGNGGKEYIFALTRRRYSESDIESKGKSEWKGLEEEPVYDMVTDSDPDSDSFGKRVKKSDEPIGKRLKPTDEFDKYKNEYKKMCAIIGPPWGETQFYYRFKNKTVSVNNTDDFWNKSLQNILSEIDDQKLIVEYATTNKHNNRRKPEKQT